MNLHPYYITPEDAYLLVIDVQERLAPATTGQEACIAAIERLTEAAGILSYKVGYTEQYPRGLGETVEPLKSKLLAVRAAYSEKTAFNGCTADILQDVRATGRRSIIVTGMETHICVYQGVRQFLEEGFKVFVPYDGVASRSLSDKENALAQFTAMGAVVTSSETLLYDMLGDSRSEHFKAISKLVK
jgi:nicotinamidase-related amidase